MLLKSILKYVAIRSASGNGAMWDASNDAKGYSMITLSATTALILLDLQKGAFAHQFAPYSGEAVLAKGKERSEEHTSELQSL